MENLNDILRFKSVQTRTIDSIKDCKNQITYDPLEISNILNKYFCTIGSEIGKSCGDCSNLKEDSNLKFHNKTFFLNPVEEYEILNLINKIDINKSNGPDDPPNYFIKISKNIIAPILTTLFNLCFSQGKFPKVLKSGHVIPIYKAGDSQLPQNYRPIILISPFSKLLESCIHFIIA